MNDTNQTILLVLAAVVVGTTLPLLLQLFLAARSLRRTLGTVDRKVDGTLHELTEAISALKGNAAPQSPLGAIGGALLPALLPTIAAAIAAFRDQMAAPASAEERPEDLEREAA